MQGHVEDYVLGLGGRKRAAVESEMQSEAEVEELGVCGELRLRGLGVRAGRGAWRGRCCSPEGARQAAGLPRERGGRWRRHRRPCGDRQL